MEDSGTSPAGSRALFDISAVSDDNLNKLNNSKETGDDVSGDALKRTHKDFLSRNSPTYDEMEHELNDLIDTYKDSVTNEIPSTDIFGSYLPNYKSSTSLYGADDQSILEHLSVRDGGSVPDYNIPSTLPNRYVSETSSLQLPSFLPRSTTPAFTAGHLASSSPPSPISLYETTFKFPYLPGVEKSNEFDSSPLLTSDYKEPNLPFSNRTLYDKTLSTWPFRDVAEIQPDDVLAFRKRTNTGISGLLSKQFSFLLFELNRLKETNEKLNDELKSCKSELYSARNHIALANNKLDPDNEKLTGIVEDIYSAQRARDVVMMDRLKEANRLKNAAIREYPLQQELLGNQNDSVATLIKTQSLEDLKASTSKLLQAVAEENQRKQLSAEEEIEAILFERDIFQKQKKELEREKRVLVKKLDNETRSKNELLNKLRDIEKDKNEYMSKANFLQNRLKNNGICENLYKSLSKEEELHQQFSNKLAQLNIELENKSKQWRSAKHEIDQLRAKSGQSTTDNEALLLRCNKLESHLQEEKEQAQRLNRLVAVLRRKLKEGSTNPHF